jgi:hypothetical protein
VALHLQQMNLSGQRPGDQARQQDPRQVEDFLNRKFSIIQRVAQKMGADIAFEDATGIGFPTRSGRTWGEVNSPPTVTVNQQRGGYNVWSAMTAKGAVRLAMEEKTIDGKRYLAFLATILHGRTRP